MGLLQSPCGFTVPAIRTPDSTKRAPMPSFSTL